jgi:hypothetical protein
MVGAAFGASLGGEANANSAQIRTITQKVEQAFNEYRLMV